MILGLALLSGQAAGAGVNLPPTREIRLPSGATLLLAEKHDVPLVAFHAWLRGGSLTDPAGKEGVAALTAEMLRKGAGKRSAREIADAADGVGGALETGATMEVSWVSGEFLSRDHSLMLELLADLLRRPSFPDSEFAKLQARSIEAIAAEKDDPSNVLPAYGQAYFFREHPYGRPSDGDEGTLKGITREDVLRSYRENYGGDRLIFSMVGDFDSRAMERKLRAALGDWAAAPARLEPVPPTESASGRHVLLIEKPGAVETNIWIGNLGVSRTDSDRNAIDVGNTYFGGRFTSLLNTALRIESGLAYGAGCQLLRRTLPGTVTISFATATENTERAIELALETQERFRREALDRGALASVRAYIEGLFPTRIETGRQIAARLAELSFYQLPADEVSGYVGRIAATDSMEVSAVARRVYPSREDLTFVLIGDAAKLRPLARRLGPTVEASIELPLMETRAIGASTPGRR